MTRYAFTPRQHYRRQRNNAKVRGIAWEFTFETWMKVWIDSGKWEQRGNRAAQYVMARHGDKGAYAPGNVAIVTAEQNHKDRQVNYPKSSAERAAHVLGRGRGWTRVGNRFQVMCAGRYVGLFPTLAEAEAAYAAAVNAAQCAGVHPGAPTLKEQRCAAGA